MRKEVVTRKVVTRRAVKRVELATGRVEDRHRGKGPSRGGYRRAAEPA